MSKHKNRRNPSGPGADVPEAPASADPVDMLAHGIATDAAALDVAVSRRHSGDLADAEAISNRISALTADLDALWYAVNGLTPPEAEGP